MEFFGFQILVNISMELFETEVLESYPGTHQC